MTYIGSGIVTQQFLNDAIPALAGVTSYTLSIAPANVNAIIVWANSGSTSTFYPPSSYTLNGNLLGFNGTIPAPAQGFTINVRYLGVPGIPFAAPNASIGVNQLSATGNASTQTFLRGDNSWSSIAFDRNRIMNGNMAIAQRGTAVVTVDSSAWRYAVDRFSAYQSVATSRFTVQQATATAPSGFPFYLNATVTSAYTVTGSDWFVIRQVMEGNNINDLAWGTASAKAVTVSFLARSSLTGTFGGAIYNNAGTRSYPFTYTITTANTWTQISFVVPGDTAGTWLTDTGNGITINWSMGAGPTVSGTTGVWAGAFYASASGATSVVATNGATLQITAVDFRVGSFASTPQWAPRPVGEELILCQRYYTKSFAQGVAPANNTGAPYEGVGACFLAGFISSNFIPFQAQMRTIPTMTYYSSANGTPTNGLWQIYDSGAWTNPTALNGNVLTVNGFQNSWTYSSATIKGAYYISGHFAADAEIP